MGSSNKELLRLEHKNLFPSSPLESLLLVCDKSESSSQTVKSPPDGKPISGPVPQSQVLGKVRDFLGVMAEANERLEEDAKDNSEKYNIEALTGDESSVIEMDLMLGIADLHTPHAVAAAEAAMAGTQPSIPLNVSSSDTESEDALEAESDGEENNSDGGNFDDVKDSSSKRKRLKPKKGGSGSKKNPKIVELS